jgi:hypothetical protein
VEKNIGGAFVPLATPQVEPMPTMAAFEIPRWSVYYEHGPNISKLLLLLVLLLLLLLLLLLPDVLPFLNVTM